MASVVPFSEIQEEFDETFGYVRQDIQAVLKSDLRLHYTLALLTCCACEMLSWHKGHRNPHAIFVELLPRTPHHQQTGRTLWEALRNGLAHRFRPDTIQIDTTSWRFSISSGAEPIIGCRLGDPLWIQINIRRFSSLVIERIDAYEQELRTSAEACSKFKELSEKTTKVISNEAANVREGLNAIGAGT